MGKRVIISISSDIGINLANRWIKQGHRVTGTFRTESAATKSLVKLALISFMRI